MLPGLPENDPSTVLLTLRGVKELRESGEDIGLLLALLRAQGDHEYAGLCEYLNGLNAAELANGIKELEPKAGGKGKAA
jgi:hypothetical protein